MHSAVLRTTQAVASCTVMVMQSGLQSLHACEMPGWKWPHASGLHHSTTVVLLGVCKS
jgi:hypothetical protein